MIGIFKIFLCYLWLCMYFMNKNDKVFFTLRRKNFLRKRLIPVQESKDRQYKTTNKNVFYLNF